MWLTALWDSLLLLRGMQLSIPTVSLGPEGREQCPLPLHLIGKKGDMQQENNKRMSIHVAPTPRGRSPDCKVL